MKQLTKHSRPWFLAQLGIATAIILLPFAAQADTPLAKQGQNANAGAQVNARAAVVAQPNLNCTLIVPPKPLSAEGLATPYELVATDLNAGPCIQASITDGKVNNLQSAFVQAAVLDPASGQISIYNPLVITQGTTPAKQPVPPVLPKNAIVALWFGSNAGVLTLQGPDLRTSGCINGGFGGPQDQFGQFAYCNAIPFYLAAHRAIRAGKLKVPSLGTGSDGEACPTVRDFSVVDQDQSDNLPSTYLVTSDGSLAQDTPENRTALSGALPVTNASDNRLVSVALDNALDCSSSSWKAPDLASPGKNLVPALPLNELQARSYQTAPVALVPKNDPFTLTNGQPNLLKLNLYRLGVDQPLTFLPPFDNGDTARYCRNLYRKAPGKLSRDADIFKKFASPQPDVANSLYTFMGQRLDATITLLNCVALTGLPNPITVTRDGTNVATDIKLDIPTVANNTAAISDTLKTDAQQTMTAPVNVGPADVAPAPVAAPNTATTAAPVNAAPNTAPVLDAIQLDNVPASEVPQELAPLTPLIAAPDATGTPATTTGTPATKRVKRA